MCGELVVAGAADHPEICVGCAPNVVACVHISLAGVTMIVVPTLGFDLERAAWWFRSLEWHFDEMSTLNRIPAAIATLADLVLKQRGRVSTVWNESNQRIYVWTHITS